MLPQFTPFGTSKYPLFTARKGAGTGQNTPFYCTNTRRNRTENPSMAPAPAAAAAEHPKPQKRPGAGGLKERALAPA